MKYKIKETYKDLPNSENYVSLGSGSTHLRLMAGEWVECNPTKELEKHLTKQNKTTSKEVNK